MRKIIQIAEFIFGKNAKTRYKRIIILLIVIVCSIILIQNISFGIGPDGFYFNWGPAAKIEIKKGD